MPFKIAIIIIVINNNNNIIITITIFTLQMENWRLGWHMVHLSSMAAMVCCGSAL